MAYKIKIINIQSAQRFAFILYNDKGKQIQAFAFNYEEARRMAQDILNELHNTEVLK